MMKNWLAAGAVALTLGMTSTASHAASVTQPGEQVGLSFAPLPEGIYAINTFDYGRRDAPGSINLGVNVPILVYSTGLKLFGAAVEPLIAVPSIFIDTRNPAGIPNSSTSTFYNPFIANILAWDLGNHVNVAYLLGAYLPFGDHGSLIGAGGALAAPTLPQLASATIRNEGAITYNGEGLNLTAALTHGYTVDDHARFGGRFGSLAGPQAQADWLNLDLTATKTFGKFEIGAVAFGSYDLPVNRRDPLYTGYARLGQFAVGGLIGYNFGPVVAQVYVTRDVAQKNYGSSDTRGWFRLIVPLYSPTPVAAAPLVRKY